MPKLAKQTPAQLRPVISKYFLRSGVALKTEIAAPDTVLKRELEAASIKRPAKKAKSSKSGWTFGGKKGKKKDDDGWFDDVDAGDDDSLKPLSGSKSGWTFGGKKGKKKDDDGLFDDLDAGDDDSSGPLSGPKAGKKTEEGQQVLSDDEDAFMDSDKDSGDTSSDGDSLDPSSGSKGKKEPLKIASKFGYSLGSLLDEGQEDASSHGESLDTSSGSKATNGTNKEQQGSTHEEDVGKDDDLKIIPIVGVSDAEAEKDTEKKLQGASDHKVSSKGDDEKPLSGLFAESLTSNPKYGLKPQSGSKSITHGALEDDEDISVPDTWQKHAWDLTLATAEQFADPKQGNSVEALGKSVLKEVPAWHVMEILPRAIALLDAYQAAETARPNDEKSVPGEIQLQVHMILVAEVESEMMRLTLMYHQSQLAATVDNYQAEPRELGPGIGHKTVCFNKYVEATYSSSEEFRKAALNNAAMAKARKPWKKRKDSGDKLRLLIEEFGVGILLAIPPNISAATFQTWTVGKTKLLIHALKAAPWAAQFRRVLDQTSPLLLNVMQGDVPASEIRDKISKELQSSVISESHLIQESKHSIPKKLRETIRKFPNYVSAGMLGCLGGCPQKKDILTLRSGHDISDEIIRAVLGIELDLMPEPRQWQVVDPSWVTESWIYGDRRFEIYKTTNHLLIPVHHAEGDLDGLERDDHWTITYADLQNKRIWYYDSFYHTKRESATTRTIINMLAASKAELKCEWNVITGPACAQKGRECGICLIANGVALLRGEEVPTDIDDDGKRFQYAQLITQKWWASVSRLKEDLIEA